MLIFKPNKVQFFSKPQEVIMQLLQENNTPVNNLNYYPYKGA